MPKKSKKLAKSECVQVIVRVRPLDKKEINNGSEFILDVDRISSSITIRKPKTKKHKSFTYDAVYPPMISQQELYEDGAFHLVESVAEGFNGTIFAYG